MHPADLRPGMYAGPQGSRTDAEWRMDARHVYNNTEGVDMGTNKPRRKNNP